MEKPWASSFESDGSAYVLMGLLSSSPCQLLALWDWLLLLPTQFFAILQLWTLVSISTASWCCVSHRLATAPSTRLYHSMLQQHPGTGIKTPASSSQIRKWEYIEVRQFAQITQPSDFTDQFKSGFYECQSLQHAGNSGMARTLFMSLELASIFMQGPY